MPNISFELTLLELASEARANRGFESLSFPEMALVAQLNSSLGSDSINSVRLQ